MKAEALWIVEPKKIEIRPVEVSDPKPNEVQLREGCRHLCVGLIPFPRHQCH